MATTSRTVRGRTWLAVAVAAGVLASAGVWFARDDEPTTRPVSFWRALSASFSEKDPPEDVTEIATRSDAVVVARVTDVVAGRDAKPSFDSTPVLDSSDHIPTSYVQLTVDRVVAGSVAPGATLNLEMFAPPSPLTLKDLRAGLPTGEVLVFLWNKGDRIARAGHGATMDPRDRQVWTLASQRGLVAQGPSGIYEALHGAGEVTPFIASFGATTVEQAATRAEQALR
jgi:hypothetical protein